MADTPPHSLSSGEKAAPQFRLCRATDYQPSMTGVTLAPDRHRSIPFGKLPPLSQAGETSGRESSKRTGYNKMKGREKSGAAKSMENRKKGIEIDRERICSACEQEF